MVPGVQGLEKVVEQQLGRSHPCPIRFTQWHQSNDVMAQAVFPPPPPPKENTAKKE